ncbi:hypothetical protein EDC96DRAFT_488941 [Choanephora cucurbitarum]|nr:hypothetical protein EDC96DRAFT_488941 [Choanephora cucurbitarum]
MDLPFAIGKNSTYMLHSNPYMTVFETSVLHWKTKVINQTVPYFRFRVDSWCLILLLFLGYTYWFWDTTMLDALDKPFDRIPLCTRKRISKYKQRLKSVFEWSRDNMKSSASCTYSAFQLRECYFFVCFGTIRFYYETYRPLLKHLRVLLTVQFSILIATYSIELRLLLRSNKTIKDPLPLKKNPIDCTKSEDRKIYCFQIQQHQRWWFLIGWTDILLSQDPSEWTDVYSRPTPSTNDFCLPPSTSDFCEQQDITEWHWIDPEWTVTDNRWHYADWHWEKWSTLPSNNSFTRKRMWYRRAERIRKTHMCKSPKKAKRESTTIPIATRCILLNTCAVNHNGASPIIMPEHVYGIITNSIR